MTRDNAGPTENPVAREVVGKSGRAAEGTATKSIAQSLSLDKACSCAIAVVRAIAMRGSRALPHGEPGAVAVTGPAGPRPLTPAGAAGTLVGRYPGGPVPWWPAR